MQQRSLASLPLCILIALAGCATPHDPVIITRMQQWGGSAADESLAQLHTISHITLHHQGMPFAPGQDPQKYLRNLQSWSRGTKGWIDVPYHFVIDLEGRVYEGRDLRFAGDTNTGYDPVGHAQIEVLGNYEDIEPSPAQLEAIVNLMARLAARYRVPLEAIRGHRDVAPATECPGRNLYHYFENGYFREHVRERLAKG